MAVIKKCKKMSFDNQFVTLKRQKNEKKNFGSLKKGRIFAFAFKETNVVDKQSKRTLNYFET